MSTPAGPNSRFTILFDESDGVGLSLSQPFQRIYQGDWHLPTPVSIRPYIYVNFAASRDGRISFNEPGHMGGGEISDSNMHDRWLMGLLRARADAVLVGDNTLRLEAQHIWTAEYIYPADAMAFAALRSAERRCPVPLHIFLSLHGDLPPEAAVFDRPDIHIVVATTTHGGERMRKSLPRAARVDLLELGTEYVDLLGLMHVLRADYDVQTLLCEGGPRVYGSLLKAGLVDDEFLTLCPIMIGNAPGDSVRPGLVEGVAFAPGVTPRSQLVSLRRAGDHLFLRSRYDVRQGARY